MDEFYDGEEHCCCVCGTKENIQVCLGCQAAYYCGTVCSITHTTSAPEHNGIVCWGLLAVWG